MYFIFHPANDFADVIGAFYFSHMVFQFVGGSKFYFKIEIKKNPSYIFIGSIYLYISLILEYRVIYLLLLCRYSLNFTNLYGKCFSFKFSVVIMECVVVLIGVTV